MPQKCPHCGQPMSHDAERNRNKSTKSGDGLREAKEAEEATREYDHRGIALPRRTRVGGIIMPQ